MIQGKNRTKMILIGTLVGGISYLHYDTPVGLEFQHVFYRELYFVPIILAAFWFGLRGALVASLSITGLFSVLILTRCGGFSLDNFDKVMEMLLYNVVAVVLGTLIDRRQEEQSRLREAETLAVIGRAVSCVAHDMKTPLITVGGLTRLVQKHLKEDDPDRARLDFIIREAERLEYMVKKMLDFSRPLELDQSNERVEQMIGECLSIVAGIAQERKVTIETQFSNDLPLITVDVMRMKQAFVNLLTNAIQASPEGESVTVRTSQEKGNIIVDVVDCGPGISADKTGVVFHLFFTTRAEGTGLGLPIAKRIVEAHDGFLQVLSNHQKGATFRTALPTRNEKGIKTHGHRKRPY